MTDLFGGAAAASVDFMKMRFDAGSIFTPGSPINERELFAGRIEQVGKILGAISQTGYHAALFGERGVGKTSLSNVLADFLREAGARFLLSRVNCDASDDFSSIWKKAFQDIVLNQTKPGLGFVASVKVEAINLVDQLPDIITPDLVRRTSQTLTSSGAIVFIFDEFDRVIDSRTKSLMADTIKSLSDHGLNASIVLIGVAESVDELIAEHHSIERALVQIAMPRMSRKELEQLFENGLKRLGMTVDIGALEELCSLSQGMPYIAHLLALHGVRAAIDSKAVNLTQPHIDNGIKQALEQWQQSIKSAYYEASKSQQPGHIYKEVLLACALADVDDLGYFTAAAVRQPLRIITNHNYDIPNFARHLKELSQTGRGELLQRVGEKRRIRYRLHSPIMRPYIVMRGFSEGLLTRQKMRLITGG